MLNMQNSSRPIYTVLMFLSMVFVANSPARGAEVRILDVPPTFDVPERIHISKETAMGDAYLTGKGVARDFKLAAYWYEKGAGLGDPVAQNQIGYLYQVGLGVEKDPVRAVHWYQLAAANGLTNAKVNLAVSYVWGMGITKSPSTGEELLLEAAAKGDGLAATYLGDLHYLGISGTKDEGAGVKWYEKGVKLHSYLAAYRMGMILSGSGPRQNLKRALSLLRESAAAGFVPAMHSAGLLLVNHPAMCSSHEEALTYLSDAASAGTWQSSLILGALSRDGKWVPQDDKQAYLHFRAGAMQGGDTAQTLVENDLKALSLRISQEDRASLDKEAEAWAHDHDRLISRVYKPSKGGSTADSVALENPGPGSHAGTLRPFTAF
jgi:TPR repeat protein